MSEEWPAPPQGFATIPRSLLLDPETPWDAKLVYLVLTSHVGGNDTAWPKQVTIAKHLHISVRQVGRALHWLRDHHLVSWRTKTVAGMRSFNIYTIHASSASSPANSDRTVSPVLDPDRTVSPADRTVSPAGPDCESDQERESKEREELFTSAPADARPEVTELCNHLADWIARNDSDGKRPNVGKRWLDACRLLIDVDGRSPEQVRKAIDWCQADEFWRTNILSMPTLRKQYRQLQAQAQRGVTRRPEVVVHDFAAIREQQRAEAAARQESANSWMRRG